ncbi:hypothetical protein D3C72_1592430 [compost metagenome]
MKSLGREASISVMSPGDSKTLSSPWAMPAVPSSWNTAKYLPPSPAATSWGVRYKRAWHTSTKLSLSASLWYSRMRPANSLPRGCALKAPQIWLI